MPMGISSAPAWFQRFINGVLREFLIRDTLGVYLDDIILFSSSLEEHEADVLAVIAKLKERNVKTSFEKSQLVSEKIEFLGNTIERGEIKMLPKRATGLQNMKTPKTLADLKDYSVWQTTVEHTSQSMQS